MARVIQFNRFRAREKKPPSLKITKLTLRERATDFARRLRFGSPTKKCKELFEKIENALEESEGKEGVAQKILRGERIEIERGKQSSAMFQFLKGVESGIIEETKEAVEIAEQIREYSHKLAVELERQGIKHSRKDEKSVYYLFSLLAEKIKTKETVNALLNKLFEEKREIEDKIKKFIEREKEQ